MFTLMILLHVSVCLALIIIILFQSGKGASIGAAFGGSSQTVFGSRGPASFLHKLTTVAAVIFMLTSLGLTIYKARLGNGSIVTTQGRAPAPPHSPPSEAPAGR